MSLILASSAIFSNHYRLQLMSCDFLITERQDCHQTINSYYRALKLGQRTWRKQNTIGSSMYRYPCSRTRNLRIGGVSLISLTDRNGILRCGGWLSHADLPYSAEHPIHLDANHGFTNNVGMRNVPC